MAETEGLACFERTLGWDTDGKRGRSQFHTVAQPSFVSDELLHPNAEVGGRDAHELEGCLTRVKPLFAEQMGFGTGAMKHRHDRLAVLDHVAVQFHHFALFAGTEHEDGHPSRHGVPNLAPALFGFRRELADGHVRNHRGQSHRRTRMTGSGSNLLACGRRPLGQSKPLSHAHSARNTTPPAAPLMAL